MAALGLQVDRDGDIPVGTQLTWQIQALITEGRLQPGEQLPSVRRLAEAAGVNVNTIRSVYDRLEGEGFVRTEHGRGSFVAENVPRLDPRAAAVRVYSSGRSGLREQITALEAELMAHAPGAPSGRRDEGPRVLSTGELTQIRDDLVGRLEQLDAMRDDLVEVLASIRSAIGEEAPAQTAAAKGRRVRRPRPATG
ncbi:MAG TPA: GntR family transcriptional regulator [Thermoleophilaceae bacterium]